MTIPVLGVTWPPTNGAVPAIITYSFADERFETYLKKMHPDYPALDGGLTPPQMNAFRQATKVWEQAAGVDFVEVGDTPWVSLRVGAASVDGAGGILGVTGLWNSGATTTMAAIGLDRADIATATTATTPPAKGELSFYQLVLHELGHVIGLDHTTVPNDLMYPRANGTVTLSTDDIAAAVSLYGPPKPVSAAPVPLTPSQAIVEKCYIAYYGRPADPGGLAFWTDQLNQNNGNPDSIIKAFTNSPESQSLYNGLPTAQVVTNLYNQLFGRVPETEGLNYWTAMVDNGSISPANIMMTLLDNAHGTDAVVVNNKLTAAALFTRSGIFGYGTEDLQDVRTWLAGITTDVPYQEAVTAAINAIGVNLPVSWDL